jgi:Zn-dependent peptidase ImmA (M78 family)
MKIRQLLAEDKDIKENFVDMFSKFLPLAMYYIDLKSLPKMIFITDVDSPNQPTFGMYVNNENILYVALANRHPVDILRTVAHELVHYKQDTEHQLNVDSGQTGSPEENQANQVAGIVMRHFNKRYPEFLKSKPIIA